MRGKRLDYRKRKQDRERIDMKEKEGVEKETNGRKRMNQNEISKGMERNDN